MSGHTDVPAAGLHGVQGGSEGEGEVVEMVLEIAVAGEAEPADDSNNRRRVGLQALGNGANAEEHVLTRMLEDRPDDFLPFDTQLVDALGEMGCGCLGGYLLAIHVARGLPNLRRVST